MTVSLQPDPKPNQVLQAAQPNQSGTGSILGEVVNYDLFHKIPTSGIYRVSVYLEPVGPAMNVTVNWTDNDGIKSAVLADRSGINVWCLSGSNLSADVSANGAGTYKVHFCVEAL